MTDNFKGYSSHLENNDCGVRALANAIGIEYTEAHAALKAQGRKDGGTTYFDWIQKAVKDRGFVLSRCDGGNYKGRTVRTAAARLPATRSFLLYTARHYLVVRAGQVLDWTAGRLHKVKAVYVVCRKDGTPMEVAPAELAHKDGLRKPQLAILRTLVKAGVAMDRKSLASAAGVDHAGCTEWIGSDRPDTRAKNDAKHFPSLLTLGFVTARKATGQGRSTIVYSITDKGRKALEK